MSFELSDIVRPLKSGLEWRSRAQHCYGHSWHGEVKMKYEITVTTVTAFVENPYRPNAHRVDLTTLRVLSDVEIDLMLAATARQIVGMKYLTQVGYLRAVNRFGKFLRASAVVELPTAHQEWQRLVVELYAWHLSSDDSPASLISRQRQWCDPFLPWFHKLIEEGLIPAGVTVPKARIGRQVSRQGSSSRRTTLGTSSGLKDLGETFGPNKTLFGPIDGSSDQEYLAHVEQILKDRSGVLTFAANDYWLKMRRDNRTGRNMMRRILRQELGARFANDDWSTSQPLDKTGFRPYLVTHPEMADSGAWTLAIMSELVRHGQSLDCVSTRALKEHLAFGPKFLHNRSDTPLDEIEMRTALSSEQQSLYSSSMLYMRFLGILNPVDMAVAAVILIQEHPNLTPRALIEAQLLDERGHTYLVATEDRSCLMFSVEKPRARTRKYAHLTPRAARVMRHLIRATAPVRAVMRRAGSPLWRCLFVGNGGRGFGHLDVGPKQLTATNLPSLARYYPELQVAGLTRGTLDFSKVRATQGILEWFATGSFRAVSKKLGNTYQVALENYIPPELIRIWNEKVLRRFQNILIALASSNESYSLAVSDAPDEGSFNSFIDQVVVDFPRDASPLGGYIHAAFSRRTEGKPGVHSKGPSGLPSHDLLSLSMDPACLALLYAYAEVVTLKLSESQLAERSAESNLSPNDFVQLAFFLRQAATREVSEGVLSQSFDLARLRRAHAEALSLMPALISQLSDSLLYTPGGAKNG
jgi:hypothetical protein